MMAVLDVFLKNEHIDQIELTAEALSIGRKQNNGLILHDLTVSRNHARLTYNRDKNYWCIENLSATNPVKLNGDSLIRSEILFHDDHIFIGTYTLIFRETESIEQPKSPARSAASKPKQDQTVAPEQNPEVTKVVSKD